MSRRRMPDAQMIEQHASSFKPIYETDPNEYRQIAHAILKASDGSGSGVVIVGYTDLALVLVNTFAESGIIASIADDAPERAGWTYRGVPVEPLAAALERRPRVIAVTVEPRNVELSLLPATDERFRETQVIPHPQPNPNKQYVFDPLRHDPFYRVMLERPDRPKSMLRDQKLLFLLEHLRQVADVGGDAMELGVYRGGSAWCIGRMLEQYAPDKHFYCYDLFEDMPVTEPEAIMCYDEVRSLMSFSDRNVVIQGNFSDHLDEVRARKHAFIHFDLGYNTNWVEACWESLNPGGVMVFDNFGLMGARNPIKFGAWFANRGLRVSYAPHPEQAWIRKPA